MAVPHRYRGQAQTHRRLSGYTFAVKDTIDVQGMTTTAGSRAYAALRGDATRHASCVQKLLDQGATLLGKTKTASLGDGDTTTADWVEYACPWNPRGDGYLIPSGSSTGSACAVASYAWLDFAIGTDSELISTLSDRSVIAFSLR